MKLARQLLFESPRKFTKLPAYRINWVSIEDIRRELKKYGEEEETGEKIEEHLSSLLSKISTSEIRFALVATLSKFEVANKDIPFRKNKLIELFSQLIFDKMSILANLTKSAKRNNLTSHIYIQSFSHLLGKSTINSYMTLTPWVKLF